MSNIAFPPGQFGDYTSFLEIGFALNVLFTAWRAIPANLAESKPGFGKYAERPGSEAYEKVGNWSEAVIRWGRRSGIAFAFVIVAALYGLPDDAPVDLVCAVAIMLSAAPLPLTFVLVHAIDKAFLLWLIARNVKGVVAHWVSIIILARDMQRSEGLRERWKKEQRKARVVKDSEGG